MSFSYTDTDTVAFTRTHAKHMATKVATDLKRMQRFYGDPSDVWIVAFEDEAIKLIKEGYLYKIAYGFQRNGNWIEPTLSYTARELAGDSATDDAPGRIRPRADINRAQFHSFLTYSLNWTRLDTAEKMKFEQNLPFRRTIASEPGVDGYMVADLTYSSGGRALDRTMIRNWR